MNIQDFVVLLLVLISVVYAIVHLLRKRKKPNPCDSCPSGCELRSQWLKKQEQCSKTRKK